MRTTLRSWRLAFPVALACLVGLVGAAAWAAFTDAFDPLRAELNTRKAALTDAADKASRKQLAAVDKALGRIAQLDADLSPSLALDLRTAGATFGPLEKAFKAEFPKKGPATGNLAAALDSGAATLKQAVEQGSVDLAAAVGRIPTGKLKTAAQKQSNLAGKALGRADVSLRASAVVGNLKKAQTAVTKGLALAAKAPVVNTVTATIGTAAYVGQNNYIDYFPGSGGFTLISNSNTKALGGFASFQVSPFIVKIEGPGDYPITGTMATGSDPVTTTSYYISSGTLHLEVFDPQAGIASGKFTLTVTDHPERSSVDGAFDFHSLRIQ